MFAAMALTWSLLGSLQHSPYPLAGLKGPTSKRIVQEGRRGEGR